MQSALSEIVGGPSSGSTAVPPLNLTAEVCQVKKLREKVISEEGLGCGTELDHVASEGYVYVWHGVLGSGNKLPVAIKILDTVQNSESTCWMFSK